MPSQASRAVGFSRVLGLSDATTLGLSISFAVAAIACMPIVLGLAPQDAPALYLLAFLLYLPLILGLADRSRQAEEVASFLHMARTSDSPARAFFVGWLKIGGLVAIGGLLTQNVVVSVDTLASLLYGIDVPTVLVGVLVIFVAALNEVLNRGPAWAGRRAAVVLGLLALAALLVRGFARQPGGGTPTTAPVLELHDLAAVGFLAAGLWGMDLILAHRPQLRRPDRTTTLAMVLTWAITAAIGCAIALLLVRHPDLRRASWTSTLSWQENRLELVSTLIVIGLSWLGLSRVIAATARVMGAMRRDNFLPPSLVPEPQAERLAERAVCVAGLLMLLATYAGTPGRLAGMAAVTFLWAAAVVLEPWVRSKRAAELSGLPFHPLIPAIGIGVGLFLAFVMPRAEPLLSAGWLAIGLGIYLGYARGAARQGLRAEKSVGDGAITDVAGVSVLVAVTDDQQSATILRAGAAMAAALGGRAVALEIVTIEEHTPLEGAQATARKRQKALAGLIDSVAERESLIPVVRLAPTVASGILETADEYQVDWIVMGSPARFDPGPSRRPPAAELVFSQTSRDLAVIRAGAERPTAVIVGTAGGPNAPRALELGQALSDSLDLPLKLVHVQSAAGGRVEAQPLESTLAAAQLAKPVETQVVQASSVYRGLTDAGGGAAIVIVGATIDRLLDQSVLSGLARDLLARTTGWTIGVKSAEARARYLRRRLWSLVSNLLPTLSISERAEVFGEMRHLARANVDFYVLISLASAIATLGLALNSAAVIIGAMLVAPLMSPILALAHGIVQGHLHMMRRSAASIVQGVTVALAVSVVASSVVPSAQPTAEILARTQPNLLDLLVALASGAAAAYAVSRKSVAAALPGVAISAALVPPLCVVGFGLATSQFPIAGGALLLFVTNLAAIVLVGGLVFLLLGFRPSRAERGNTVRRAIVAVIAALILLTIPLTFRTRGAVQVKRIETQILDIFREAVGGRYELRDLEVSQRGGVYEVSVSVYSFAAPAGPEQVEQFRRVIEEGVGRPIHLKVSVVDARLLEAAPRLAPEDTEEQ